VSDLGALLSSQGVAVKSKDEEQQEKRPLQQQPLKVADDYLLWLRSGGERNQNSKLHYSEI